MNLRFWKRKKLDRNRAKNGVSRRGRKYLLKQSVPSLNEKLFPKAAMLPPAVDLRHNCSPVVDQGQQGSCTANAIGCGLREYLEISSGKPLIHLSRQFLYDQERLMEGTVDQDSGAMIKDGMTILQGMGIAPEADDAYFMVFNAGDHTTPQAISDAGQFKISAYHIVQGLDGVRSALATGQPVVIGIDVYESFEGDDVARTGIVPMPTRDEAYLGGHAVCVVGYDNGNNWLIVRNSWGNSWGSGGYFFLDFNIFNEICTEAWTGA